MKTRPLVIILKPWCSLVSAQQRSSMHQSRTGTDTCQSGTLPSACAMASPMRGKAHPGAPSSSHARNGRWQPCLQVHPPCRPWLGLKLHKGRYQWHAHGARQPPYGGYFSGRGPYSQSSPVLHVTGHHLRPLPCPTIPWSNMHAAEQCAWQLAWQTHHLR